MVAQIPVIAGLAIAAARLTPRMKQLQKAMNALIKKFKTAKPNQKNEISRMINDMKSDFNWLAKRQTKKTDPKR